MKYLDNCSNDIQDMIKGTYWNGFKCRKPSLAKEIELLVGRNLSMTSDTEAFEIVTTLQRWAETNRCAIGQLKENYLKGLNDISDEVTLKNKIALMKEKQAEEAVLYNISKENTISALMIQWIQEKYASQGYT